MLYAFKQTRVLHFLNIPSSPSTVSSALWDRLLQRPCQAWNDQSDTESYIRSASERPTVSLCLPPAYLLTPPPVHASSLTLERLGPPVDILLRSEFLLRYYLWRTAITSIHNKLPATYGISSVPQKPLCSVAPSTSRFTRWILSSSICSQLCFALRTVTLPQLSVSYYSHMDLSAYWGYIFKKMHFASNIVWCWNVEKYFYLRVKQELKSRTHFP